MDDCEKTPNRKHIPYVEQGSGPFQDMVFVSCSACGKSLRTLLVKELIPNDKTHT